jgi:hypothetical protein
LKKINITLFAVGTQWIVFFIVSGSKRTRILDYHFHVFKVREWIESRVGGEVEIMLSRRDGDPNSLNPDPDSAFQENPGPGFQNLKKKQQKLFPPFFYKILQFTYP